MAQGEYHVSDLPEGALEASALFHSEHLVGVRAEAQKSDLMIILPPADYNHTDWRRALARDLAREYAPSRVNVIAAGNEAQKLALTNYLSGAKGVTGHYLEAHD